MLAFASVRSWRSGVPSRSTILFSCWTGLPDWNIIFLLISSAKIQPTDQISTKKGEKKCHVFSRCGVFNLFLMINWFFKNLGVFFQKFQIWHHFYALWGTLHWHYIHYETIIDKHGNSPFPIHVFPNKDLMPNDNYLFEIKFGVALK